jgi:hypothetical protein
MAYTMMSDEELGLDTVMTQNGDGGKTITVETAETEAEIVLQLEPHSAPNKPSYVVGQAQSSPRHRYLLVGLIPDPTTPLVVR